MSGRNVEEFKLDIDKRCDGDCTCEPHPHGIKASKEEDGAIPGITGFFRYTHELEGGRVFRLRKFIGRDYELKGALPDATKVSIYYWTKAPRNPLLLEVYVGGTPQYYYKYSADELIGKVKNPDPNIWTYNEFPNVPLQERLDDRNCGINGPTVFDAKTPLSSPLSEKSDCARTKRKIHLAQSNPTSEIDSDYTVTTYRVDGDKTTISRVTYGGVNTTITLSTEPVTKIRVYSWKHNEIPLLIEFVKSNSKGYTWFENTHQASTTWSSIGPGEYNTFYDPTGTESKQALTTKLVNVNCTVNNVVEIDVLKGKNHEATYCHGHAEDTHLPKRLYVRELSHKHALFNYKVYSHTPNPKAYTKQETDTPYNFTISKFKGKGGVDLNGIITPPSTPYIEGVTRFVVYFCQHSDDPLLVYYKTVYEGYTGNTFQHYWFKKDSTTWTAVPELSIAQPDLTTSYTRILEQLDSMQSPCQPPKVIIDIGYWPAGDNTYESNDTSCTQKNKIQVESKVVPQASDYNYFTHTVQGNARKYFTVTGVKHGQDIQSVSLGEPPTLPIHKVTSFNVYYWKHNPGKTNPLLIKLEKHGSSNPEWFCNLGKSGNTTWNEITSYKSKLTEPSNLLKKLILLNCKLNGVTIIDIGKKHKDGPYCHEPDPDVGEGSHDPKLIQVTEESTYKDKIGKFVVYKHAVNPDIYRQRSHPPGTNFHISGFKKGDTNIKLGTTPVLKVPKVLVFWCSDGPNGSPLLVHFKHNTTPEDFSIDKWYKKNDKSWTKLEEGEGKPSSERDTNAINKILNSYETKCKDKTMIYILTAVPAILGPPGIAYGIWYWYNFLRGPWLRLM